MKTILLTMLFLFTAGCGTQPKNNFEVLELKSCVKTSTGGFLCKRTFKQSSFCYVLDGRMKLGGYAYSVRIPCKIYMEGLETIKNMEEL